MSQMAQQLEEFGTGEDMIRKISANLEIHTNACRNLDYDISVWNKRDGNIWLTIWRKNK